MEFPGIGAAAVMHAVFDRTFSSAAEGFIVRLIAASGVGHVSDTELRPGSAAGNPHRRRPSAVVGRAGEKARMVVESLAGKESVSAVAQRVFTWRRQARGGSVVRNDGLSFVFVVVASASIEIEFGAASIRVSAGNLRESPRRLRNGFSGWRLIQRLQLHWRPSAFSVVKKSLNDCI